jgi:hypothetical protein
MSATVLRTGTIPNTRHPTSHPPQSRCTVDTDLELQLAGSVAREAKGVAKAVNSIGPSNGR